MGVANYLIEGVSGAGKTTVCDELHRRGYQAIHGDRELAYQGDPATGTPTATAGHAHHIWDVSKVDALVADHTQPVTLFCGGSRNFGSFIDLFDEVFLLTVDRETLIRRLEQRPANEWGGQEPNENSSWTYTAPLPTLQTEASPSTRLDPSLRSWMTLSGTQPSPASPLCQIRRDLDIACAPTHRRIAAPGPDRSRRSARQPP